IVEERHYFVAVEGRVVDRLSDALIKIRLRVCPESDVTHISCDRQSRICKTRVPIGPVGPIKNRVTHLYKEVREIGVLVVNDGRGLRQIGTRPPSDKAVLLARIRLKRFDAA